MPAKEVQVLDRHHCALPRLHVLIDVHRGSDPLPLVDRVLDAGAPLLQLRAKGLTDAAQLALARAVVRRCAAAGALCIVNDRVDIALAAGADGVHLGGSDLPLSAARELLDTSHRPLLLGGTARDAAGARAAAAAGADYLGVGPCYPTRSKVGLPPPGGPERIADAAVTELPVVAIAGVTVDHVAELVAAGAHGVAVIGAVARAEDPAVAVAELLAALEVAA